MDEPINNLDASKVHANLEEAETLLQSQRLEEAIAKLSTFIDGETVRVHKREREEKKTKSGPTKR